MAVSTNTAVLIGAKKMRNDVNIMNDGIHCIVVVQCNIWISPNNAQQQKNYPQNEHDPNHKMISLNEQIFKRISI